MRYSSALILHSVIILAAADLGNIAEFKVGSHRVFRRGYGYDNPNQYGNLGQQGFGEGPVPNSASYGGGLYGASGNYNAGSYGGTNGRRFNVEGGGGYGSNGRPPLGATHSQATSQVTVTKTEWSSGQSRVGEQRLGGGGMNMDLPVVPPSGSVAVRPAAVPEAPTGSIPPFVDDGNLAIVSSLVDLPKQRFCSFPYCPAAIHQESSKAKKNLRAMGTCKKGFTTKISITACSPHGRLFPAYDD